MGKGLHYSIRKDKSYFITMKVVEWIDLFTRLNHKRLITDSLNFCTQHKGLEIFGWCLMPSHLHMMCNAINEFQLADTIRDFKKFTSKKLIEQISNETESRRDWMLDHFSSAADKHSKTKYYKIWQDGNHAIEIYTERVAWQKLNYIHQNPVKDGTVEHEQDYLHSSARDYHNIKGLVDVCCLTPPVITTSSEDFFRT